MKLSYSQWLVASVFLVACSPAESQTVAVDAKLPGHFGAVSNVVEMSDGRVAFADTKGKVFLRGDLRSGKVDTIGTRVDSLSRTAGPGEYRFPGWVAHLAGDTLALVDFTALRTTLWSEAGKPVGVLPISQVAGNTPVLLYDTTGHGYKIDYQAVIGGGEPGRAIRPDSIPVLRLTIRGGSVDTVALLIGPEYGDATFGDQVQQAAKVFAPNDFFGVLPDGTAWVARGRQNRVDWRSPDGHWTFGKAHPFTKVPVTQADKDRVLAQVKEHGKQFGMPQEMRIVYPFAASKPPFEYALGRPNGEVWLQRPRAREDAAFTYDVFNRKGSWEREVTLPQGSTLAGFGRGNSVYASVKNDDGTRTVARLQLK
jgi:hypothetical protein